MTPQPTRTRRPRRVVAAQRPKAKKPRTTVRPSATPPPPEPAPAPLLAAAAEPTPQPPATPLTRPRDEGIDLFDLPLRRMVSFLWSWFWRSLLYVTFLMIVLMVFAFAIGIVIGLAFIFFAPPDPMRELLMKGLGYLVGFIGSIAGLPFFLRYMTTRPLGRFRLILREEP